MTLAVPALEPLDAVLSRAPAGHELARATGWWAGGTWSVTAALERTAVLADPVDVEARRHVVRHGLVFVDPESVTWRPTAAELLAARRRSARGREEAARNTRRRREARSA